MRTRLDDPDRILASLDTDTRIRASVVIDVLHRTHALVNLTPSRLNWLITDLLPEVIGSEQWHDVAWALADFFDVAGEPALASACRDPRLHLELAALRRDPAQAGDVGFYARIAAETRPPRAGAEEIAAARHWSEYVAGHSSAIEALLPGVLSAPDRPSNLDLALAPVLGFFEVMGSGIELVIDADGEQVLPPEAVSALNDRFRWADDLGRRPASERELPQSLVLREHLTRQGLVKVDLNTLRPTDWADHVKGQPDQLWMAAHQSFAVPHDRQRDFEGDMLGWFGALVCANPGVEGGDVVAEVAKLVSGRWTLAGVGGARDVELIAAVRAAYQRWYAVGMVLGWWQRRRGRWLGTRTTSAGEAAAALALWSAAHGLGDRARRPSLH